VVDVASEDVELTAKPSNNGLYPSRFNNISASPSTATYQSFGILSSTRYRALPGIRVSRIA